MRPPPRYILVLCLLIPLALLATNCSGNSDSTTSEDSAPDDRRDSRSDSQNIRGILSHENDSLQSFSQNRAIAIAASDGYSGGHTCALRQTGTITCWGSNEYGQLGNGQTTISSPVPVEVLGITDATAIAVGGEYTCALRQTGTIKCWGNNRGGQLGNGQTTRSSPVPVEVLGITDATTIATGGEYTCALRQAGTIACWGDNRWGQLGNGQSTGDGYDRSADSLVPVEVLGITDATQITAGYSHTCALRQTGTIKCWGNNWSGQLGNGTETDSSVPVEVLGIINATTITVGNRYTCALLQTGTIKCWGDSSSGQLGNGTETNSSVPVEVLGITDATAITATSGNSHHKGFTCAIRQTGTIKCWGDNSSGQLGNGQTTGSSPVPVEVLGITDATTIATGGGYTCAIRQTGTITCWGNNDDGQLGNGQTTSSSSVPVEVLGITNATTITAVSTYNQGGHACALRLTGSIACWGNNTYGQLGNGTETNSSVPVEVLGITDATTIRTSGNHTCALLQTGTIKCWGNNEYGQLGNGTETNSSVPVEVLGITDATTITRSGGHTCALLQTGTIKCWGDNSSGQLGNGTETNSSVPVEVLGITDPAAIAVGSWYSGGYTCALLQTGTIKCWGNNEYGQLGNGTETNSSVPVEVLGITDATAIAVGGGYICALRLTGSIACWGNNTSGQLGNGTETNSSVPVEVLGITDVTTIRTSGNHTCALLQTGTIKCWGNNWSGQLGNGQSTGDWNDRFADELPLPTTTEAPATTEASTTLENQPDIQFGRDADSSVPVEVLGITNATTIATGGGYTCALLQTGTIKCWGGNSSGQLGNGQTTGSSPVPVEVLGITNATTIATGGGYTCALLQTGTIKCWGGNSSGQLGNGAFLLQDVIGFGG